VSQQREGGDARARTRGRGDARARTRGRRDARACSRGGGGGELHGELEGERRRGSLLVGELEGEKRRERERWEGRGDDGQTLVREELEEESASGRAQPGSRGTRLLAVSHGPS
jgi:hypothetical protein